MMIKSGGILFDLNEHDQNIPLYCFQSVILKHNHESCNQDEIDKLKSIDTNKKRAQQRACLSKQYLKRDNINKFIQSKCSINNINRSCQKRKREQTQTRSATRQRM